MSYESEIRQKVSENSPLPNRLEIGVLRYFWQSNPLLNKKKDSIPRFLRSLQVFASFSENELRILSKFLHLRKFKSGETIFKQGDLGVGFYLIYSGFTDIIVKGSEESNKSVDEHVLTLERFDYFGELALLQDASVRNATAVTRQGCELLGIFKPDIDELIQNHPIIAAKLLQAVSLIVANRLFSLTREVQELKYKISTLVKESDDNASK